APGQVPKPQVPAIGPDESLAVGGERQGYRLPRVLPVGEAFGRLATAQVPKTYPPVLAPARERLPVGKEPDRPHAEPLGRNDGDFLRVSFSESPQAHHSALIP